ncbi:MAG: ATP-binding protein [Calditrichaeota bacterium]|nr:MAG: ATP-binding protein [Calditrichota bacterium]
MVFLNLKEGKDVGARVAKDFEVAIPSSLEEIASVERLAEKAADKMGFSEEEKDSIAIAVTEAVNNAILHGNKQDKQKQVRIKFLFEKERLTVKVKDQGEGFDPNKISDPLAPENLLKESGRGIFILSSLMDEVKFNFDQNGTEIILVKEKK